MLYCIYNGKSINYYDFVGTDESKIVENKIKLRELSAKGELHCKGCGEKVTLVSSEKRRKHFRHQKASVCSYDQFTKEHGEYEEVKCFFYDIVSKQPRNYAVTMDKRLSDGTWVDIAFEYPNGEIVVLNFIKRSFPDIKLMSKYAIYFHQMTIPNLWIIDGEPSEMNDLVSMFDKDALLMQADWQNAAMYCKAGDPNLLLKFKTIENLKTKSRFAFQEIPIADIIIGPAFQQSFITEIINRTNDEIEAENEQYLAELERKRLAREKKREREAQQKAKEAELKAQQKTEEKLKKEQDIIRIRQNTVLSAEELHKSSGKFIGMKVNGKYELFDLQEIKVNKNSTVEMTPFTREMFEAKLKEAFAGYAAPIRYLIFKLFKASDEEKDLYLDIMSQYRGLPKDDERFRILAYISIESELREYKNKKNK
ncbi:hypothetical protein SAMN02910317_02010 [Ruminococcaceae bacterium FB2012]|nr:hypothetical protein SAMN02910317_02010 [Ruminococcaceae bacterium FB2012]